MKRAIPRPQARADLHAEIVYYRKQAGKLIANQLAGAADDALQHLQQNPGTGSLRIGQILEISGLRSWRVTGFPLIWFYFEREDHLDVVRLLGERQDILTIFDSN
ncbi:MAG: type II toxin-antitoxin system RelE/ParE family toxin [Azonexus sp.]|nr:type II toxin-antitoxin system RelE/ParE family toxin [Azonexus sp.]MCK6413140.1 type II toxin-antitoxin system RelE/ParE family toxin [Azonexus sp.]